MSDPYFSLYLVLLVSSVVEDIPLQLPVSSCPFTVSSCLYSVCSLLPLVTVYTDTSNASQSTQGTHDMHTYRSVVWLPQE